jgi:membrane protein
VLFGGIRGAFSRFFGGEGFFLAAGLAFSFLVCLIPLTLIGVSTVGFVLSTEEAAREVVGQLARNFPVYRAEITRVLLRIVQTRRASGLIGTVVLVFFSTPLFGSARLVMHRMLGVKARPSMVKNFLTDAALVVLLGPVLFGATAVTWVVQWFQELAVELAGVPSRLIQTTTVLVSLALSVTILYLCYRYVPYRRVRVGAALTGAVVASLLWELAKQLFRAYIRNFGVYDQIYGPLGVLVAVVMFVYYTAVVFVFGAAYVASLDARRR